MTFEIKMTLYMLYYLPFVDDESLVIDQRQWLKI